MESFLALWEMNECTAEGKGAKKGNRSSKKGADARAGSQSTTEFASEEDEQAQSGQNSEVQETLPNSAGGGGVCFKAQCDHLQRQPGRRNSPAAAACVCVCV